MTIKELKEEASQLVREEYTILGKEQPAVADLRRWIGRLNEIEVRKVIDDAKLFSMNRNPLEARLQLDELSLELHNLERRANTNNDISPEGMNSTRQFLQSRPNFQVNRLNEDMIKNIAKRTGKPPLTLRDIAYTLVLEEYRTLRQEPPTKVNLDRWLGRLKTDAEFRQVISAARIFNRDPNVRRVRAILVENAMKILHEQRKLEGKAPMNRSLEAHARANLQMRPNFQIYRTIDEVTVRNTATRQHQANGRDRQRRRATERKRPQTSERQRAARQAATERKRLDEKIKKEEAGQNARKARQQNRAHNKAKQDLYRNPGLVWKKLEALGFKAKNDQSRNGFTLSKKQVTKSFRKHALFIHPDKHPGEKVKFEALFKAANSAKEYLKTLIGNDPSIQIGPKPAARPHPSR